MLHCMMQMVKSSNTKQARVSISIRVEPEFAEAFKQQANAEGRSIAGMAKWAMREYLDKAQEEAVT